MFTGHGNRLLAVTDRMNCNCSAFIVNRATSFKKFRCGVGHVGFSFVSVKVEDILRYKFIVISWKRLEESSNSRDDILKKHREDIMTWGTFWS